MTDTVHYAFAVAWLVLGIGYQFRGRNVESLVCRASSSAWVATL